MLPPVGDQVWNPALPWQPIPVVSDETIDAASFGIWNRCPALKARVLSSPDYQKAYDDHLPMVRELEKKTGMPIDSLYIYQKVLDTFRSRASEGGLLSYIK